MERDTWMQRLEEELRNRMGEEYQITPCIGKDDIPEFGITKQEESIGITITLEDCEVKQFDREKDIQPAAMYVQFLYQLKREMLKNAPGPQNRFEDVKDHIIYVLYGRTTNEAALTKIPYEDFLDMLILFRLHYVQGGYQFVRTISNLDLKSWGVGVKELSDAAKKNTPVLFPPAMIPIDEANEGTAIKKGISLEEKISRLRHESDTAWPMYVLTNEEGKHGATCILYEGLLDQIADIWKTDLIILPSSVDETLFLPDLAGEAATWLDTVMDTNRTKELEGKVLSDSVYLYDYKEKQIKLAATALAGILS